MLKNCESVTKNSKQAYQKNTNSSKTFANTPVKKQAKFTVSEIFPKITRVDVIAMAAIVVVYSCIALYDLGDMHAAETATSQDSIFYISHHTPPDNSLSQDVQHTM